MKLRKALASFVTGAFGHSVGSAVFHGLAIHLPGQVLAALAGVVTGGVLVWVVVKSNDAPRERTKAVDAMSDQPKSSL